MEQNNCPYCTLPQVQAVKIIENNYTWAFPTNIPIVPGHILVIPKRHIAKYDDLTNAEKSAIEELRIKLTQSLKKTFKSEGFNFAWNDGKNAGQSIPHFHLHIVPRKEGDEGIYEYEPRKFLYRPGSREETPEAELKKVAQLIAENIN